MQKLLLTGLYLIAMQYSYSQPSQHVSHNTVIRKDAIVRQEQGEYRNQTGQVEGSYKVVYIIDTAQKQLLNVSTTSKDRHGEVINLYYYEQNRLTKTSSGVVQRGYTIIQNTYDYEKEDFVFKEKDLYALSQTEEKYALFKEGQKYLAVLKKL